MANSHTEVHRPHHVCIKYGDGAHFFLLAQGTTLGELAQRVDGLDMLHNGAPLTIEVIVDQAPVRATPSATSRVTH